jgi:hypothetical protein
VADTRNATIEAPEFERIKKGDALATYNAIYTLYNAMNAEAGFRRVGVRLATERERLRVFRLDAAAAQHNLDTEDCGVVESVGAIAFDLTGIRNGCPGDRKLFVIVGAGTMTVKHNSGSSAAGNKILAGAGADITVASGSSLWLTYLSGAWRETKSA